MESRRGFYSNNSNSNSSSNILLSRSSSNYSGDGRKYTGNKSNQKYSSKGRGNVEEIVMLQRPTILSKTPIVTKQQSPEQENSVIGSNVVTLIRKDEISNSNTKINNLNGSNEALNRKQNPVSAVKLLNTNHLDSKNGLLLSKNPTPNLILQQTTNTLPSVASQPVISASSSVNKISAKEAPQTPIVQPNSNNSVNSLFERLSIKSSSTNNNVVRLLDENLQWKDDLLEQLIDQPDFLVVGVLGKQGVGKSTLISLLAGSRLEDDVKPSQTSLLFKTETKESSEQAIHKTNGIQAYVTTSERTIFLDVQPLLSGSVLDKTIKMDKKYLSNDFKYYENYIELQSIELACFVLSVCNVVLVTEDWFIDPNLFRLLQTAEMLMPNLSNGQLSNSSSSSLSNILPQDDFNFEHHPHLVYVLNKSDFINKLDLMKMKYCIDNLMKDSKLIYKGSINQPSSHLQTRKRLLNVNSLNKKKITDDSSENVNMVVMPKLSSNTRDEFTGLPSMEKSVKHLLREILAVKRSQSSFVSSQPNNIQTNMNSQTPTSSGFTEKKWFSYANKIWETIRKSSLISEYNRLMT